MRINKISHRDLKPSNIIYFNPSANNKNKYIFKLIDFGCGKYIYFLFNINTKILSQS